MAELTPLITADDLCDLLSTSTFMQIFDDDPAGGSGNVAAVKRSRVVQLILAQAHARCVSWLPSIYTKIPDGTDCQTPELLRGAELEYARAMAWERHREYARASGVDVKDMFQRADEIMERIQESTLRIVDTPPEPEPENVGGIVRNSGPKVFVNGSGDF